MIKISVNILYLISYMNNIKYKTKLYHKKENFYFSFTGIMMNLQNQNQNQVSFIYNFKMHEIHLKTILTLVSHGLAELTVVTLH